MKLHITKLAILGLTALTFQACDKDDTTEPTLNVPTTYNFENVSYSGQTDRLNMLGEITPLLKNTDSLTTLDATTLKDMYRGANNPFTSADLNASTKNLFSKTFGSDTTLFLGLLDAAAAASTSKNMVAADGQAGIASSNDGNKKYFLSAKGMEYAQLFEKGLMGACFKYQATAVYMGAGKMDVDNETVEAGKGTKMEHHFDEAFGYYGAPIDFPTNTGDAKYWAKYSNTVNAAYSTINSTMMDAFLTGRAAISAKDNTKRDEQIAVLQKNWDIVAAGSAIHYINDAIANLDASTGDQAKALHEMSEAFAFAMALKYGAGSTAISAADVNSILTNAFGSSDPLQANFYNTTVAKLEAARDAIASKVTDLESVKTSL
jgi:hypothetical protein